MAKDIYEVLKKVHSEAREILDKLVDSDESDEKMRREKGHLVAIEVIAHHEAESKCFYKRLEKYDGIKNHIREHQQEHEQANEMLREWMQIEPTDAQWLPMLKDIKKELEHHIEDEENELFPQAQELLSEDQAEKIAEEFQHEMHDREEHLKAA
ncbi:MAG TPA: hemerythrin domain-containing protein [Gammaproteobacteria bacterium]|jgi:hemerythrin-like domain-containing protein|nr:hemerythrin domain-containing protein [Gammaproteobacteria bacterium]